MKDESELENVANDEAHAIFERDMKKGVILSAVTIACTSVATVASCGLIMKGEAPATLMAIPSIMFAGFVGLQIDIYSMEKLYNKSPQEYLKVHHPESC